MAKDLFEADLKVGLRIRHKTANQVCVITSVQPVTINPATTNLDYKFTFDVKWEDPAFAIQARNIGSMVWGWIYSYWTIEEDVSMVTPKAKEEKPCDTCQRPNDVGVSVCWCCGNPPHVKDKGSWWVS